MIQLAPYSLWVSVAVFSLLVIYTLRGQQAKFLLLVSTIFAGINLYLSINYHNYSNFSLTITSIVFATAFIYAAFYFRSLTLRNLMPIYCWLMFYFTLLAAVFSVANGNDGLSANNVSGSKWLYLHIFFAVFTYALLTLAAISALAVVIKETALKRKIKSRFADQLPSVFDSNFVQFRLMLAAEFMLLINLLSGISVNIATYDQILSLDHKTVLSLIAFLGIAILLILHNRMGIRGRKAAHWVLVSYLLITLGYPGVKFITDIIL